MSFESAKAGAVQAVFANMGVGAVFNPAAGDPVECTVIKRTEEDTVIDGYESRFDVSRTTVRYLLSEIGRSVRRGETFTIDGADFTATGDFTSRQALTETVIVEV